MVQTKTQQDKQQMVTTFVTTPAKERPHGVAVKAGYVGDPLKLQPLIMVPAQYTAVFEKVNEAVTRSVKTHQLVSFQIDVAPDGTCLMSPLDNQNAEIQKPAEDNSALQEAIERARERGKKLSSDLLQDPEMLTGEEFAQKLHTTRATVNSKRKSGQILGLEGNTRGVRYPQWQLDDNGNLFKELPDLHARLGGPWAVFRFLTQVHDELDGITGLQGLQEGKGEAVLAVAETVGRDFS